MDYIRDSDGIRAMTRSIVDDVIPRTDQGYPRGQLWAIVGLLENLAVDLDNQESDASVSAIRPGRMVLGTLLEGDILAQARQLHDELVALIARQAPLNSGRAVLGR
jgi:hypothetical protein